MPPVPKIEAQPVPYPKPVVGAPNMVTILLDDIGFGQLGCYGSLIDTPNIDALAQRGVRFNRFHVTSICSSTRAALFTGRNHHAVGIGATQETPFALPGYSGRLPKSAIALPRILRDNGYNTMANGISHRKPNIHRQDPLIAGH
jgi:arylsulfatase A-like enzyme